MRATTFFIILSATVIGLLSTSFARMIKMTDEELEQVNQADEVTIKDIIVANAANVKFNENWQVQPKFLIEIDLSALPPSAAQKLVCPVFGCVGNFTPLSRGAIVPGNLNPSFILPFYPPYLPSYR